PTDNNPKNKTVPKIKKNTNTVDMKKKKPIRIEKRTASLAKITKDIISESLFDPQEIQNNISKLESQKVLEKSGFRDLFNVDEKLYLNFLRQVASTHSMDKLPYLDYSEIVDSFLTQEEISYNE